MEKKNGNEDSTSKNNHGSIRKKIMKQDFVKKVSKVVSTLLKSFYKSYSEITNKTDRKNACKRTELFCIKIQNKSANI